MNKTLLNFEMFSRPENVQKAKEIFLKGHVTELYKDKTVWAGRIKISYDVQILLDNIKVKDAQCTCGDQSMLDYCEHKLAVLFALRKELDLYPALTNSSIKLPSPNTSMRDSLYELNYSEDDPRIKDIDSFTRTARHLLKAAGIKIAGRQYKTAIANCMEIIRRISVMDMTLQEHYYEGEKLKGKAFELLNQAAKKITDEELLEQFAHDLRVATLRNFRTYDNDRVFGWLGGLLVSTSKSGNRAEKFKNVAAVLQRIDTEYPEIKNA